MNASELRGKSDAELAAALEELLREQFNLRMQNASGQLGDNSQIGKVRKNIAKVKTVMNEKSRSGKGHT